MADAPVVNDAAGLAPRRRSALAGIIRPGRHGASGRGTPGVFLSEVHPLSMVTIIARKGKAPALDAAMKKHFGTGCPEPGRSLQATGIALHWAGPEQWLAVSRDPGEGRLYRQLDDVLKTLGSISDQSHGRACLAIAGPRARDLLAKGTPVDVHETVFGPGQCALTQMAHVGVHLACTGQDRFELSLFRGFAESFWEWLTEMSLEFGYEAS